MAQKSFYLVRRKDRPTAGKPTWYVRLRGQDGGRLTWRSTGETAKARAEQWALAEMERAKKPVSDLTLGTFAADFFIPGRCSWMRRQAAKGRAISNPWARAKRRMLEKHVFPALGKVPLARLTRPAIERFIVDLVLSNQTRNHLLYTLKTVLAEAEAEGLITRNPLEHAEPLGKQARKRDVFALEELRLLFPKTWQGLLKVWGEAKYAALYMTMATTGIREGEARALRWRHILPEGWLAIEEAVKEDNTFGAPKSGTSRAVALPSRAQATLSWWAEQSPYTEPAQLVFFGDGPEHPLNRRTFQDVLTRALEAAGVTRGERFLTTHSLRHTYNTMMRRSIPADTLRALIGHRDERMTDHYDHPGISDLVQSLKPARAAIEKALQW